LHYIINIFVSEFIIKKLRALKLFVVILSVYVLGLTVMPCISKDTVGIDQTGLAINADNQNHQDDIDNCSPFCSFSCCQNLFQPSKDGYLLSRFAGINIDIPFILKSPEKPVINLWRPPKI
jgi:hypothetical protein